MIIRKLAIGVEFMKYVILGIILITISSFINYYILRKIYNSKFTVWYKCLYKDAACILFNASIFAIQIPLIIKYDITITYGIYAVLSVLLITIAWIDIKTKKIPNALVIIGVILGLISMFINKDITIYSSILGAVIISGILIVLSLITKGAIGMGDAKVFFFIGLFLGLPASISVFIFSILISGIISALLLIFRVVNRKTAIPFAPFIFISTLLIIIMN